MKCEWSAPSNVVVGVMLVLLLPTATGRFGSRCRTAWNLAGPARVRECGVKLPRATHLIIRPLLL